MLPDILKQPDFYDNFGIVIFSYLTIISILLLKKKIQVDKWLIYSLLSIGILGLIVDGSIVTGILQTLGVTG